MTLYMYDIIGGKVANSKVLLQHKEELTQICDCILNGCREEKYRLEAINIKAKLLNAQGLTAEALALLQEFPDFGNTAGMRSEQLFEYDSEESRSWVRKNLYSLADGFAIKLIKRIWFGEKSPNSEKVIYAEKIGDGFTELFADSDEIGILVLEHKFWESLALRMTAYRCCQEDIIRIRNKELNAAEKMQQIAKTDNVLNDMILKLYKEKGIIAWTIEFLETAPQKTFAELRNNEEYIKLLQHYKRK